MKHVFTTTATILRSEDELDIYGDSVPGEITETPVACHLVVTSTSETAGDVASTDTYATLFLPSDAVLFTTDRVVVDSEVWDVVAPPVRHRSVGGTDHHVEAQLRRRP